jgi:hypothetical protein
MDDASRLTSIRDRLNQDDRGVYFAPIRHHSPACAWAVRQLIREVKPRQILIEAPVDLHKHVKLLLAKDTVPPVALAVFVDRDKQSRLAAYYPFCSHSPEYVALVEGQAIKATLRFIDLPSADKAMLASRDEDEMVVIDDEQYFDSGDFIAAMCRETGCRNGFELWDHLFESQLGASDWRAFLGEVAVYCAALRESTTQSVIETNGDLAREAHMAAAISQALAGDGPVVVVTGGFHTPALVDTRETRSRPKKPGAVGASHSYLIRYGFEALDALSGYGAGLPQPGYYDYLWTKAVGADGAPQWRETALELLSDFGRRLRDDGHGISVPAQVEALRVAEALAAMRGRRGAARYDLIDAVRTALVKGEVGVREVWTQRLLDYLRGTAIGDVPASAGSPPIVEDARARAKSLRIDVSDGSRRRRRLDIRRKPAHLSASRFFHAMTLVDSTFAERQMGPDFIDGVATDRLFEEWSYAWSPTVEGRLIEIATHGDSVISACVGVLGERKQQIKTSGHSQDIAAMAELFVRGVLAGLDTALVPFLDELATDVQSHGDFSAVANTLRRLHNIAGATGPLQISPELSLNQVREAAYRRLVYLCDDLPKTPEEAIQDRIEALRLMMELLRSPGSEQLDAAVFHEAVSRVADSGPPPEILGCVLAIALHAKLKNDEDICRALSGSFLGTVDNEKDRIGVLRGVLFTMPEILWRSDRVLKEADRLVCELGDEAFLALLPHIRLAFTSLNPREADRVAGSLARLHGGQAAEFMDRHTAISEHDLERGIAMEQALGESLSSDGLDAWLEERP